MIDLTTKFGRKVKRHLKDEYVIWLTTVGPDQAPHPRPVWFIWDGTSFLIFSKPGMQKLRDLSVHPQVALNFNTDAKGDLDVIVLLGTAIVDASIPPANKVAAYLKKYRSGITDLRMTPEEYGHAYSVAIRVTPTAVRGW